MLVLKSELYALHGRFEESLLLLESVLKRNPENTEAMSVKAYDLLVLTLAASEGRLGRIPRAKVAFADFNTAVPGVNSIAAVKQWMHPAADLAGYEPLFEGLRLAGVPD